ncbi:LLM class flavin-dependent oxidoreductase [Microbacterium lushaniae]|uniref:LLM class flavin-dependent oxidoreductase n=1 Tax=Microbacterium lushaniae TaxID=2614639 RepID=A0A5J6L431_9MICO|nr:LLM class flavin-dependent oxidoreductase [Microbacterium lushaniae]QEW03288.1 LLM class flavin-dependent oxidoreductase [Microbacterium lushaniae]
MISRFSVLYQGGVIDGDQLGYDGPAVHERRYDNDRLMSVYDASLRIARACDEWGYDTLWLAEHHFQHEGYEVLHNLPMTSLWLAQNTTKVRLGCGFNIIPTWNPLRLAEDYATADHLTGNRIRFGVGRGYHEREIVTMNPAMIGMPDAERRAYFEEEVEVLRKAFSEDDWQHHGTYFDLPPKGSTHRGEAFETITLVPKPTHEVEIWQPTTSGNPAGLDFMARNNIRGMVAGMPLTVTYAIAEGYRDAYARQGVELELGENLIVGMRAFVAPTEEEARAQALPNFEEYAKFGAPLGVFLYTDELIELHKEAGLPIPEQPRMTSFEDTLASGAWFAGTPEQLVTCLREIEARLPGLEEFLFNLHIPASHADNLELLRIIADEVMPHFAPKEA